jgi:hypothetical protein
VSKIVLSLKMALAIGGGLAATMAHAEPFSLAAGCRLTSLVAGQSQCMLSGGLVDLGTSVVRRGQIKVNGVLAGQSNNDTVNPLVFTMEGEVQVACGASYTVTGHVLLQGTTTYAQVGSIPAVTCPKAP